MGRQVTEYHVRAAQEDVLLGLGAYVEARHIAEYPLPSDPAELADWDRRHARDRGEVSIGGYLVTATDAAGWTTVVTDLTGGYQGGHPLAAELSRFVWDTAVYGWHNTTTNGWRWLLAHRGEILGSYLYVDDPVADRWAHRPVEEWPPGHHDLWDIFGEQGRSFGGHGFCLELLAHVHGPGAVLFLASDDPPPYWVPEGPPGSG